MLALLDYAAPATIAIIPSEETASLPGSFQGISYFIHDAVIATMVKIPPMNQPPASILTFAQLPCTPQDEQKIHRLISSMAEHGKMTLLLKYQGELRQIGRDIEYVHPLKFLSIILSDSYLKSCLKKIRGDYFKWTNFMDGLGDGLSSQAEKKAVAIYLNDFAKKVGVAPESIQRFIETRHWEDMVVYLLNN